MVMSHLKSFWIVRSRKSRSMVTKCRSSWLIEKRHQSLIWWKEINGRDRANWLVIRLSDNCRIECHIDRCDLIANRSYEGFSPPKPLIVVIRADPRLHCKPPIEISHPPNHKPLIKPCHIESANCNNNVDPNAPFNMTKCNIASVLYR